MKKIIYTISLAIAVTACSSDDDKNSLCNYTSIDFYIAVSTYQENPTTSNCIAVKKEAEKYYDAMQECPELYDSTEIQVTLDFMALNCE